MHTGTQSAHAPQPLQFLAPPGTRLRGALAPSPVAGTWLHTHSRRTDSPPRSGKRLETEFNRAGHTAVAGCAGRGPDPPADVLQASFTPPPHPPSIFPHFFLPHPPESLPFPSFGPVLETPHLPGTTPRCSSRRRTRSRAPPPAAAPAARGVTQRAAPALGGTAGPPGCDGPGSSRGRDPRTDRVVGVPSPVLVLPCANGG